VLRVGHAGGGGMEREASASAVARNRKVLLRGYIDRAPREDDMEFVDGGDVALRVPGGAGGPAVLVKNLYLSCDPYMRGRMRDFQGSYIPPFKPGSVSFFLQIVPSAWARLLVADGATCCALVLRKLLS